MVLCYNFPRNSNQANGFVCCKSENSNQIMGLKYGGRHPVMKHNNYDLTDLGDCSYTI